MGDESLPDWITTKETADLSGDDIQPVRRLACQGRIVAKKNRITPSN